MSDSSTSVRRPLSLRTHLLLLVIGTLLPTLLLATYLVRRLVDTNRATVEVRLLEAARATAAMVDSEIAESVRALQALGTSEHLASGDFPAFRAEATRLLATQPAWETVILLERDGRQTVNTAYAPPAELPRVEVAGSAADVLSEGVPKVGRLQRSSEFGLHLAFPVRVPVVVDGRIRWVLSAVITPDRFGDLLKGQRSFPDEWVRGVLDATNILVARTRDPDRWVGQQGTPGFLQRIAASNEGAYRDISLDGQAVYGAFSRAPQSHWVAGVAVPASVVDAEFQRSMSLLAALAVVLLGIGATASYVISRRIARDISITALAADAIAGGRDPALPGATVTEVQRLSDALGRAANLLRDRERERDARVSRADAARAEAEAADRAKDEFMAMLGHELRNPLAPALTALHVVKLRGGAFALRECEIIERQVRHLARLVDDLLDVSRVRRGSIDLRRERVTIEAVVNRAVEMAGPLLEAKGHHLSTDVPAAIAVDGDAHRLAQIFSNVIANAAKYTESGGHIAVSAREIDGWAVIKCVDDGMGITADLLPRIFDLFVQGDRGLDRRQGGLGLGLGVARTLVERHGGTIEAASAGAGCGSTFTVRLPVAAAVRVPVERSRDAVPSGLAAGTRVLVVEDNPDALEMMVDALTVAGFDAVGAIDAASATSAAARFGPHVAVVDIGLPRVDGYALARRLRRQAGDRPFRLVALTGYGADTDEVAAREAGFDLFLVKPVSVDELLARLGTLLAAT